MTEPFTLQLHITDRCQLQCRHCYRDTMHKDLPRQALSHMVQQLVDFCHRRDLPGRLTLAGGEPLLRLDDLLALSSQASAAGMQVHVLSNGLLLTQDRIDQLRSAGVLRVQISLDGDEPAHDELRGPGAYRNAVGALELLRNSGMWSTISMTVGQWNLHCLSHIAEVAARCRAKLFVSRFVPCGVGLSMQPRMLTAAQWKRVMRECWSLGRKGPRQVALRDPLYTPLIDRCDRQDSSVGGCAAGYGGLAVDSDGTAYPCRRLPIAIGNLLHEPLETIWRHPTMELLRDRDQLKGRCGPCRWRWRCGGCRAIAYGATGDPLADDPQCGLGGGLAQLRWSGSTRRLLPGALSGSARSKHPAPAVP